MAPGVCCRSIRELRGAASHVLLIITADITQMASVLGDVEIQACHVRLELDGQWRVELESACVHTVADTEVICRILRSSIGEYSHGHGVNVNY